MLRTLYVRVIISFITAVLVGLVSAFFITITLFKDQVITEVQKEVLQYGHSIAALYEQYGIEEAKRIVTLLEPTPTYKYMVMDDKGWLTEEGKLFAEFGIAPGGSISTSVLNGEPFVDFDFGFTEGKGLVLGMPFTSDHKTYALFVHQPTSKTVIFNQMLFVALAVVLGVGGLCIFVAAIYLVRPLKEMKQAVERMASGRFDIQLRSGKRTDELGQLAQSFSGMAKEIEQMDELRGQFVSSVSHEIQSPLTSIAGFSRMLMLDAVEDPEQKQRYLNIIYTESQRLSRLSDNLLKLAELDSAVPAFDPVTYDLDEQLRQVIVVCEPQWSEKSIEMILDLPHVKINADEDGLSQVWINVIGNAIKFAPEGGYIRIEMSFDTDSIKVSVSDNGSGFPDEDGFRLFERFYKADKSRSKKLGGSGLGLSIAQKIVNLHQGVIRITNRVEGGARVDVTLPSMAAKKRIS
ncbi:Signal transduction histidine kinase [Paenibacillus algorifonticola]|uniref:Heme sensor protein HssS n=1 Tax=Paenibacillus algorifonticola TaxID=684063 RepID=A0A1I2J0L0_9BACL|nr:HAMP domain-containing sensor histidine kinase [Paenibacillus algorifonticola]SFF46486.1 Signal transduction histidine kinase [Paenibacillus algorifonticola]